MYTLNNTYTTFTYLDLIFVKINHDIQQFTLNEMIRELIELDKVTKIVPNWIEEKDRNILRLEVHLSKLENSNDTNSIIFDIKKIFSNNSAIVSSVYTTLRKGGSEVVKEVKEMIESI